MGGFVTRVAKVGIFDRHRGLTINRGVFIEAPPDFFLRYGDDFEEVKKPFDSRVNVKVRHETWKGQVVPKTPEEQAEIDQAVADAAAKATADEEAAAEREKADAEKKAPGMGTEAGIRAKKRKG